jgi:hypothetical protein
MRTGKNLADVVEQAFGHTGSLAAVTSVVHQASRTAAGSAAYGRPGARRDRLMRAADTAKLLLEQMTLLPVEDLLGSLGPVRGPLAFAEGEERWVEEAGLRISPPRVGFTPIRVDAVQAFAATLATMEQGLRRLAADEPPANAGRPVTPDALTFLIECLAQIWKEQKGAAVANASFKHGQFGGFVLDVVRAGECPFPEAEVRTALRRFNEQRRRQQEAAGA